MIDMEKHKIDFENKSTSENFNCGTSLAGVERSRAERGEERERGVGTEKTDVRDVAVGECKGH